jgi:hypothetical protein
VDDWNNFETSLEKNIGMGSGWERKSRGLANTSIMQTRHETRSYKRHNDGAFLGVCFMLIRQSITKLSGYENSWSAEK